MEQLLRIGVITRSHGVHGEVKVFPTTDRKERFEEVERVIIKSNKGDIEAGIEDVRYFKNLAIVKFDCFNSPEEAQGFAGSDIMIDRKNAQPLEEGEYYIADLIGCNVVAAEGSEGFNAGEEIGLLKDVLQTGANDCYVVEMKNKKELLLPVIRECIVSVDIEKGIIKARVLKGLMD